MNWFKKHKILTVVLVFIALIVIVAATGGSSKQAKKQTAASTTTPAASQPAWDAQAIYDKITTGMTRAQAEEIIGKGSGTCTESAAAGIGTLESCNYNGGLGSKGTISVGYLNGTVNSKTKLDF